MRWSLADLLVFVLLAGIVLGVYRGFWGPAYVNARIIWAANLALLSTATVGAWCGQAPWRRMCLAYAIFGWSYVVVVMHVGLEYRADYNAPLLARYSIPGVLMSLICALLAYLFFRGQRSSNPSGQPI